MLLPTSQSLEVGKADSERRCARGRYAEGIYRFDAELHGATAVEVRCYELALWRGEARGEECRMLCSALIGRDDPEAPCQRKVLRCLGLLP